MCWWIYVYANAPMLCDVNALYNMWIWMGRAISWSKWIKWFFIGLWSSLMHSFAYNSLSVISPHSLCIERVWRDWSYVWKREDLSPHARPTVNRFTWIHFYFKLWSQTVISNQFFPALRSFSLFYISLLFDCDLSPDWLSEEFVIDLISERRSSIE